MTCHVVHQLGNPQFGGKTKVAGDQLCLSCHEQVAQVGSHSVHSFGNCTNCHMPRIAKSAESGDIRSHVFTAVLPKDTLEFKIPNSCQTCHKHRDDDLVDLQTKDLHGLRMGITCVQCHRSEPVAGVYHYYSALNPIRRHAHVCAKCHEGATPSFASYMVHEPNPVSSEDRETFPLPYYAVWVMLTLAVGVFVVFLPYTVLWWIRDLVATLKGRSDHG